MESARLETFESTRGKAWLVAVLIGLHVVCDALMVPAMYVVRGALRGAVEDNWLELVNGINRALPVASVVTSLLYIAAGVSFLIWLRQAIRNLPALGSLDVTLSPAIATWGFLIPLVNLVRPHQVMSRLWLESQPVAVSETGFAIPRRAPIVTAWWACFLIGSLLTRFNSLASNDSLVGEAWIDASYRWTAVNLSFVVAGVLCIKMVLGIDRRQREQYDDLVRRIPVSPPADRLR